MTASSACRSWRLLEPPEPPLQVQRGERQGAVGVVGAEPREPASAAVLDDPGLSPYHVVMNQPARHSRWRQSQVLALGTVLVIGFCLRVPQIGANLPYFYDPDETTHFNRLVRMVQSNDYHPYYFLKPSLHFYLRMPAVAGGFLWSARAGEMRSVHEIVTTDNHAPDRIARTASHPRIVMWARSVTLLFSLLLILATAGIASRFVTNPSLAVVAAALVACALPLIEDSEKIGVDTLMAAMCVVTAWLSLRVLERPTLGRTALAGLAAGLAVSSKYNAMPIVVVPLLACLLSGRFSPSMLAAALGLPAVGFFAGTPYGLFYPADLLDGMAREIAHYGLPRSSGPVVEPGWPHAVRFLRWLSNNVGVLVTLAGIAGAALLPIAGRHRRAAIVMLAFPMAFGVFMFNQKLAFFRNMLVLIPFVAVAAAWVVERLATHVSRQSWMPSGGRAVLPVLVFVLLAQPAVMAITLWRETGTAPESRRLVSAWLDEAATPETETAIAGDLRLPAADYGTTGITFARTDQLTDPKRLFLDGYDRIVVGPTFTLPAHATDLVQVHRIFAGNRYQTYIPRNPEITIYNLPATLAYHPEVRELVARDPRYELTDGVVRTRIARLALDGLGSGTQTPQTITLNLRTQWSSQSCRLELPRWQSPELCADLPPEHWETRSVTVPADVLAGQSWLWIVVRRVHLDPDSTRERRLRLGMVVDALTMSPAP